MWWASPGPRRKPPRWRTSTGRTIILSDIQLADGSSGVDAVNDILKTQNVPVIFITAYPKRLLTGERAEPTFLMTKRSARDGQGDHQPGAVLRCEGGGLTPLFHRTGSGPSLSGRPLFFGCRQSRTLQKHLCTGARSDVCTRTGIGVA